jgi:hypothetical protein
VLQSGAVLPVVRLKNKFAMSASELNGGYRDLILSVLYEGQHGLRIIGEIQVLKCMTTPSTISVLEARSAALSAQRDDGARTDNII